MSHLISGINFVRNFANLLMMNDESLSLTSHLTHTSGSALVSINEAIRRQARLVLRWVTMCGFNSRCGTMTFISVCNEPPRSTQPGHPPCVGEMSTSQRAVSGWQVKLCDPIVTHGLYLCKHKFT